MINEHLLKNKLSWAEVEEIYKNLNSQYMLKYLHQLPVYTIACCPYCQAENTEHLDTYTLARWEGGPKPGKEVFYPYSVITHCEHFVLAQPFIYITKTRYLARTEFYYDSFWDWLFQRPPKKREDFFIPQIPYVVGFALEQKIAKVVLHLLPICEDIETDFVPAHLLYLFTYFSETPKETYAVINKEAIRRFGHSADSLEVFPSPSKEKHWHDLTYWVERKMLSWVNPNAIEQSYNPEKCLLTGDVNAFPYKDPRELVKKKVGR